MATASKLKIPVQGFRPQYGWGNEFSLTQFRVERQQMYTLLRASIKEDLLCNMPPMDFTITSHVTGTTVLFEYAREDPKDWSKVYIVAHVNNGHVPNVLDLRKTLRVRLYP